MDTALRHAYLIITHGNFPILERQLRFLDSSNADFFIHVDARVKGFDFARFRAVPRHSRVTFIDRIPISWGHFSQIECELRLLEAALGGGYDYYHLLSGVDVPVKSREYIEGYFDRSGTNYLHIHEAIPEREFCDRVKYYYPLQRWNLQNRVVRLALRRVTVALQKPFVDRTRAFGSDHALQKGANWFSITGDFAAYVVSHAAEIRHDYRSTFCADEIFMQTLLINSPFRDTLPSDYCGLDHKNCLRYIDWYRGKPYTFTEADMEELLHTGREYLFARKFDYKNHPGVADTLFDYFGAAGKADAE